MREMLDTRINLSPADMVDAINVPSKLFSLFFLSLKTVILNTNVNYSIHLHCHKYFHHH